VIERYSLQKIELIKDVSWIFPPESSDLSVCGGVGGRIFMGQWGNFEEVFPDAANYR